MRGAFLSPQCETMLDCRRRWFTNRLTSPQATNLRSTVLNLCIPPNWGRLCLSTRCAACWVRSIVSRRPDAALLARLGARLVPHQPVISTSSLTCGGELRAGGTRRSCHSRAASTWERSGTLTTLATFTNQIVVGCNDVTLVVFDEEPSTQHPRKDVR